MVVPPCKVQCAHCISAAGRSWATLCSWTPGACRRHNPPLGHHLPPCSDLTVRTQHERALCPPEKTWTGCTVQETSWKQMDKMKEISWLKKNNLNFICLLLLATQFHYDLHDYKMLSGSSYNIVGYMNTILQTLLRCQNKNTQAHVLIAVS